MTERPLTAVASHTHYDHIGSHHEFPDRAVHAAEAFIFAKLLSAEDGGPMGGHVGKLLVFGYLHVMGVRYG